MSAVVTGLEPEVFDVPGQQLQPTGHLEHSARQLLRPQLAVRQELSALRAYGVEDAENAIAWPAIFVVGPDGRIAWRSLAETYRERPASTVVLEGPRWDLAAASIRPVAPLRSAIAALSRAPPAPL